MTINNILRGAGICLFILILIVDDFPFYKKMKESYVQLILAIFVVSVMIYDYILGFILTMILMLIYYEVYKKIDNKINKNKPNNNVNSKKYMLNPLEKIEEDFEVNNKREVKSCVVEYNYITPEHLHDAQNNIVDENGYNNDLNIKNPVDCGIQGLELGKDYDNITGYNIDDTEIGFKLENHNNNTPYTNNTNKIMPIYKNLPSTPQI